MPIWPYDLAKNLLKTPGAKRTEFAERDKITIAVRQRALCAVTGLTNQIVVVEGQGLNQPATLQFSHVIPSVRGDKVFKSYILPRQGRTCEHILLSDRRNGLYLQEHIHKMYNHRRIDSMPVPNIAYNDDGTPKPCIDADIETSKGLGGEDSHEYTAEAYPRASRVFTIGLRPDLEATVPPLCCHFPAQFPVMTEPSVIYQEVPSVLHEYMLASSFWAGGRVSLAMIEWAASFLRPESAKLGVVFGLTKIQDTKGTCRSADISTTSESDSDEFILFTQDLTDAEEVAQCDRNRIERRLKETSASAASEDGDGTSGSPVMAVRQVESS